MLGSKKVVYWKHLGAILESFGMDRAFWSHLETNLDRLEAALDPAYSHPRSRFLSRSPDPDLPLSLPILSPNFAWDSKIPLPLPIPDFKKLCCPLSGYFPWQKNTCFHDKTASRQGPVRAAKKFPIAPPRVGQGVTGVPRVGGTRVPKVGGTGVPKVGGTMVPKVSQSMG